MSWPKPAYLQVHAGSHYFYFIYSSLGVGRQPVARSFYKKQARWQSAMDAFDLIHSIYRGNVL